MRIHITTQVKQPYWEVAQKFDQKLFEALSPPFPKARLLRYDGNQPGDEVHIELSFGFFRQIWKSRITAYITQAGKMLFIDEGIQLPFFLKYWKHQHEIQQNQQGSLIADVITFHSPSRWLDYLLYPALYLQFAYRKPIYRRFFG